MKENKPKPSSVKTSEGKEEKKKESLCVSAEALAKADDKKIEELEKQKNDYLNGWKRERADFLNYKKEEMERIMELVKYANEELVLKILPILDNFELAFKNIPEDLKNEKNTAGLLQIHQQLKDFLKSQGIEEIKAVGEKFDANFHEVVGEVETGRGRASTESAGKGNAKESGIVVEETQKGYTMNGKVIRAARVKITS